MVGVVVLTISAAARVRITSDFRDKLLILDQDIAESQFRVAQEPSTTVIYHVARFAFFGTLAQRRLTRVVGTAVTFATVTVGCAGSSLLNTCGKTSADRFARHDDAYVVAAIEIGITFVERRCTVDPLGASPFGARFVDALAQCRTAFFVCFADVIVGEAFPAGLVGATVHTIAPQHGVTAIFIFGAEAVGLRTGFPATTKQHTFGVWKTQPRATGIGKRTGFPIREAFEVECIEASR